MTGEDAKVLAGDAPPVLHIKWEAAEALVTALRTIARGHGKALPSEQARQLAREALVTARLTW